jgi:hypothetical protein
MGDSSWQIPFYVANVVLVVLVFFGLIGSIWLALRYLATKRGETPWAGKKAAIVIWFFTLLPAVFAACTGSWGYLAIQIILALLTLLVVPPIVRRLKTRTKPQ